MTVQIDKYYIEEQSNGVYVIYDRASFKDRAIIKFELKEIEKNRELALNCLQILNTGKYEYKVREEATQ